MANIFSKQALTHESPNRNNHDLHHKRHMTGKAGVLYPFLCMETVPTDVFEIDSAAAINLMPLWYPTQSNMRFIFHYFYVPKRLLMDDYKNFLQGLPDNTSGSSEIESPFLDLPASFYKTGSLADHLGIPTVLKVPSSGHYSIRGIDGPIYTDFCVPISQVVDSFLSQRDGHITNVFCESSSSHFSSVLDPDYLAVVPVLDPLPDMSDFYGYFAGIDLGSSSSVVTNFAFMICGSDELYPRSVSYGSRNPYFSLPSMGGHLLGVTPVFHCPAGLQSYKLPCSLPEGYDTLPSISTTEKSYFTSKNGFTFWYNSIISTSKFKYHYIYLLFNSDTGLSTLSNGLKFNGYFSSGSDVEIAAHSIFCPYHLPSSEEGSQYNDDSVKIRSLQFRAYEMIYNCFYRNQHGVQPFMVNNIEQYNNYLTNHGNGADSVNYELKSRNWEQDAYTSCMPSPMQGVEPIISVSATGRFTIEDPDGTRSSMQTHDLPDGQPGLVVDELDAATAEHARRLTSLATSGLSIADFRQGNALTRFLEQSLRSGYRYVDFIFGHFGKSPTHQELDMPIFLGGYTQVVDVSKVSNVSASGDAPLGEFAGVGSAFGANRHRIKRYFDDYGYIIGIMSLVPDPAYSQILPKQFSKSGRLDEYFPEFAQLGLQPITYEELCPIQSRFYHINDSSKKLTDTFGYQRPNHDLVWAPDTVHGLFRKELSGSVIQRKFQGRPTLGDDFLKIHPEEVNSIFSVTEADEDIFIGQIALNIRSKRPVPAVVVPSLGR